MPLRKPKKFCRLTKFLEVTDKNLHQAFDDLCLFSLFRTRGTRGITFLYPTSKTYRKKIIDLAYSNTPEKAIDMIKALVLMDYLPRPSDFKNKKDDIPNSLRKKLEVEDADSKSVKLKGGLKLELDTSYVPLRSDDNVVVYKLSGTGELSTTGTPSNMKYAQGKSTGGYFGGQYNGGDDNITDYKNKLSNFVKKTYINDEKCGRDVYKCVLTILYNYVVKTNDNRLIASVYGGICASARATYYNILCPHANINTYDIPPEAYKLIAQIETNVWSKMKDNKQAYKDSLDSLIDKAGVSEPTDDAIYKIQYKALQNSLLHHDYAKELKAAYGDKKNDLAKDLLTVYCYLAALQEAADPSYYETCFLVVMVNLFNKPIEISESNTNDLAHNITLYGNLLKSDAFLFKPCKSNKAVDKRYINLHGDFPDPTLLTNIFTIVNNDVMEIYGGNDISPELLKLMGGADGFKTDFESGL
jgi:hypothetical protein